MKEVTTLVRVAQIVATIVGGDPTDHPFEEGRPGVIVENHIEFRTRLIKKLCEKDKRSRKGREIVDLEAVRDRGIFLHGGALVKGNLEQGNLEVCLRDGLRRFLYWRLGSSATRRSKKSRLTKDIERTRT